MTDEAYLGYVARMQEFLLAYNPQQRHSVHRLYETVSQLAPRRYSEDPAAYPPDFRVICSVNGKLRLAAMRMLLPFYRVIYAILHWQGG